MTITDRPARRTFLKYLVTLGAVGGSGRIVGTLSKTVAARARERVAFQLRPIPCHSCGST
jgi:hypothetical protein